MTALDKTKGMYDRYKDCKPLKFETQYPSILTAQAIVELSEKLDALSAKIDRMQVQMQTLSYNGDE